MTTINEIFQTLDADPDDGLNYDFDSEVDMDNIVAMSAFIEDHDLENYVSVDDGTMVFLTHEDYDFEAVVTSYGRGDFFSHGIDVIKYTETD